MVKHFNIHIYGRVQGVGFRYHVKQIARMHQLTGYVKNLSDGSVFVEAEGDPEKLNLFIKWCYQGPERSLVEKVDLEEGDLKKFTVFEVKF